jgi:DNA-binding NarL/FixJ family response regulator
MYHEAVGEISIFYAEECPPADEGPFLAEERALLDAVAEQIGTIATRISAEMELEEANRQLGLERQSLQETNTALRTVLTRIEQEKQEIRQDIRTNIDRIIIPILQSLALRLSPLQETYVQMIQSSLEQIASPLVRHLSRDYYSLTTTEVAVCNMIRNGMRTKEIAELRGVSEATICRHRERIRRKLGITSQRVNLATYLQSGMWDEA